MKGFVSEVSNGITEVFSRLLGYFGRDKKKRQGPTLLGMDTDLHRRVPDAEQIRKAVREAKEELARSKNL